ncbi:unnamed protein product [Lampetra planeri]
MDTPTYGQILTQQKSKETPPCGQDPKGFFGIKERTLSIGNQFDQECQLISRVRPVGRLRSSTSGSTQERAATIGSARLIFSSTEWVDSGASCDQRVGSTLQRLGLSRVQPALGARLKRLPISSAGGQDPLDSSTRPAWANLCRVGGLCS